VEVRGGKISFYFINEQEHMEFSSIETFLDEVELFPHNFMLKLSNSYEIFNQINTFLVQLTDCFVEIFGWCSHWMRLMDSG